MSLAANRWSRSLLGLALLLASSAVVLGQKKPKPPSDPPPPPPITFNLKLFPTTETGTSLTLNSVLGMNDAGDVVGQYSPPNSGGLAFPRVYLAGTVAGTGTVWDANELMTATEQDSWTITRVFDINNSLQIAVRAQYHGASDGGLIQNAFYVCLLDINPLSEGMGMLSPVFEYTLGGTVNSATVRGMNDLGVICGEIVADTTHAFVMAAGDEAPTYLFEAPWTPGAVYSQAHSINSSGQVVGRRNAKGYRFTPDEPTLVFGQVETGRNVPDWGLGRSINSTGEFCGDATGIVGKNTGGWLPVAYSDGGGLVKLSSSGGSTRAINDRRDVTYQISAGGSYLLLGVENVHVNLLTAGVVQGNSAEVTRFRGNSPVLERLNESRVISGWFDDYQNPARVAFILTPVP